MDNISQNIKQYGLVGGFVAIGYMLVLYFVDAKLMFHPLWAFIPYLVIFPTFMTLAALADRRANKGYIKMEEAFKSVFFTAAFSLFLLVAFLFLMKSVIDPRLVGVERQVSIEFLEWVAEYGEADTDQIENAIAQIREVDLTPHLGNTMMSYLLSLAMGSLPGLIIASIVRRLKPINYKEDDGDNIIDHLG